MSIKSLTLQILEKMPKQDVRTKLFWTDFFMTMLICRGKYNFTNLSRYSKYSETSIRGCFSKFFDFFLFNKCLHENLPDEKCIISCECSL